MRFFRDLGTIAGAFSIGSSIFGLAGGLSAGNAQADAMMAQAHLEAATTRLDADSLEVQVKLDEIQLNREKRDLGVTREKTMSRIKSILVANGGEGLSSQLAAVVLGEAGGEFATAEERMTIDTAIRKEMLLVRADNLRKIADYTEATGASAAAATRGAAGLGAIGDAFDIGSDIIGLFD